jgi:SAM-dependent methyltransferase
MAINLFRAFDLGSLCRSVINNLSGRRYENEDHDHYYGDTAKGYLAKRLKQESWHREQAIVREMLAALPDGVRVLDVPFGTGRFVDMYMAKNMSVHGVDISADMLQAAREALGEKYDRCDVRQCSADALPYDDGYFDVSVCFRFFGLIPLDMARRVLAELRRVTSGSLIIRVPVRKAGAPALPPAKKSEAVQGRLYEHELIGLFEQYGFRLYDQQLINEREHVQFVVYALTNRPAPGVQ